MAKIARMANHPNGVKSLGRIRGPEKDSANPTRLAYSLSMAGMNFCPFPRYGNGELVLRFPLRRRPPRAPVPFPSGPIRYKRAMRRDGIRAHESAIW